MTNEEFIAKWLKYALLTPEEIGVYWAGDPCRLYWALSYEHVTGWDQVSMAGDLTLLYPKDYSGNSAIQHARTLICSTR